MVIITALETAIWPPTRHQIQGAETINRWRMGTNIETFGTNPDIRHGGNMMSMISERNTAARKVLPSLNWFRTKLLHGEPSK